MARQPAERGTPGLPLFSGRLSLDQNTRLRWPQAGRIYNTMLNDEPAVGALRTALHSLLRTDMQVTNNGNAQAVELVESALTDMRFELGTYLRQIASAYFYGFSVLEFVYKRRPDGLVGWSTWGLRRQDTFERWETDKNGRVVAFTQRPAPDYKLRTIPLTKCLHVVADDSDGSPEGRGILRSMYRYWYMVTQFELLMGIALERFGTGMPVFSRTDDNPAIVLTSSQEQQLADIAAGIRQNEEAFVLEPPGIRFRFEPSPGVDAAAYLSTIQSFRIWMLATGLAEFIALGTGDTGSFALGKSKIDLFLKAMTGFQDTICAAINRQAIPPLMRYNGWEKQEQWPTVSLPAIREYDLASLGTFAKTLSDIGTFHPTPEDEAWFRKISDLQDVPIEDIEKLFEEEEKKAEEQAKAMAEAMKGAQNEEGVDEEDDAAPDEEGVDEDEMMVSSNGRGPH